MTDGGLLWLERLKIGSRATAVSVGLPTATVTGASEAATSAAMLHVRYSIE